MRRNMMIFQIAAGLVGAVLCAALGYFVLEKAFRIPYGSMILWILCPALILRCMQSVLLGIFQSEGSEMPSAVSAILRQVFYFGLGLLFLGIFRTYGEKVSLLLKKDDFTAMYGAMGVALGIVISEVLVLIFVFVIYQGSASGRRESEIGMKGTDTFFSQVRVLLFSMGGDIIGDLLLYLPLWTGLVLFEKNAADIYAAADSYGVFIGRYLDTMLLVVVLLCMGILPGVAKAGAHIRKKKNAMPKMQYSRESRVYFYMECFSPYGLPFWRYPWRRRSITLSESCWEKCSPQDPLWSCGRSCSFIAHKF